MCQQKPAGTEQKIETILKQLEKLGLGEDGEDGEVKAQNMDLLMLVNWLHPIPP